MNPNIRCWLARAIYVVFLLLCLEACAHLAYRLYKGSWYFRDRQRSARGLFEPHPFFAAAMVPNASDERTGVRISHNSFRMRGSEFTRPKPKATIRIVASGGSTTYCSGVSDDETWEHFLQHDLGTPWEVINNGAPGGTSNEILLQTCLLFSEVQPDFAFYYMGWNDARVQHIKQLQPDYSDFHGRWLMAFGLSGRELKEPTATGYLLKRCAFHYFFPKMDSDVILRQVQGGENKLTDQIDLRALGLFERNMRLIATVCRKQNITPVFIPQVMNFEALTADTPYGFLPFVRDRDLKKYITAYNTTLARVAQEEGVPFVGEMLQERFERLEFLDQGHLTVEGNRHFARVMRQWIEATQLKRTP